MDKPYLHQLSKPVLQNPLFVLGLPGFGNIGQITAHLLIKFYQAEPFAEFYSPFFRDLVSVTPKGICHLPHYVFYAAATSQNDYIIMTGDAQIPHEDVVAHYQVGSEILDFAEKQKCSLFVAIDGTPQKEKQISIYVAATSKKLAQEFMKKGVTIYSQGKIMGTTGLLLGLAKDRGLRGICLLGATTGLQADRGVGFDIFKFLTRILHNKI